MKILHRVFSQWRYTVLALSVAWAVFTFAVFLSNLRLLGIIIAEQGISFSHKFSFALGLYGSIATNFTALSALTTGAVAVLVGLNIALLTFYIRKRQSAAPTSKTGASAGFLGLISGIFGIGCAACGSVILTGLLSSVGAFGLLAVLPFHGAEFGILAIIMLSYSAFVLCKRISDPLVCPV